jgi:hypothetical protein
VIPHHVDDLQVFEREHVVLLNQLASFRMVEVPPLPLHLLVRFGQECDRLVSAVAPVLAPRYAPLRCLEPSLGRTIPA